MHRHARVVVLFSLAIIAACAGYGTTVADSGSGFANLQCTDPFLDGSFEAGYWRDWTPVGAPWKPQCARTPAKLQESRSECRSISNANASNLSSGITLL